MERRWPGGEEGEVERCWPGLDSTDSNVLFDQILREANRDQSAIPFECRLDGC